MSDDAGSYQHDSTSTVFTEQMLSESAMSKYHSMVNQQAQAAAAIMILGPTAMKAGDESSPSYQADESMHPPISSDQQVLNEEVRVTQLLNNMEASHTPAPPVQSVNLSTSTCSQRNGVKKRKAKDREEVFKCHLCSYRSKWSHGLSNHMRTHNNTTFECTQCDYSTPWKGDLKNHMRVHNGDMFSCDQCDFKTYRKQGLEKHVILHTGAKPYQCPNCDYSSAQPGNLKKHMMRHTGEKPISCDLCTYKCRQTSQLKQHVQQHHATAGDSRCSKKTSGGEKAVGGRLESRNRQYTCVLCRLSWKSRQTYTKHMHSRHSSSNHFKCGYVCHQTFPSADQRDRHKATHEGKPATRDAATNTDLPLSIGQTTPSLHNCISLIGEEKFASTVNSQSQPSISQINQLALDIVNSSQSTVDISQISQSTVPSSLTPSSSQSDQLPIAMQGTLEQSLSSQSMISLQTVGQSEAGVDVHRQEALNIVDESAHLSWSCPSFTS